MEESRPPRIAGEHQNGSESRLWRHLSEGGQHPPFQGTVGLGEEGGVSLRIAHGMERVSNHRKQGEVE